MKALLVSTIKGGFLLERGSRAWKIHGPFHLGSKVHDFRVDPRDGRTLLLTSTGGHLGPTIFRSKNLGKTWTEAKRPPQFEKKAGAAKGTSRGQAVKMNFWLEPGPADQPGSWYCGTSPPALFHSRDGGATWSGVEGFNGNPKWLAWTGGGDSGTPDGSMLHSILVHPKDSKHLYVSTSSGGTFESLDAGKTWKPMNRGVAMDFKPGPPDEYGHDPHCAILHPADPDRLYQQNHCGIYRLDRKDGDTWVRIGKNMPKAIGDIGFVVVGHPADRDTVWVFPMNGTSLWPRTPIDAKPAIYRTQDAGRTWERLDRGLPREHAYFTVKRQAMVCDGDRKKPGIYFGTTGGEIWESRDGGENWNRAFASLPHIYGLRWAQIS